VKALALSLLLLLCTVAVAQQLPDSAGTSRPMAMSKHAAGAPPAAGHSTFGGDQTFRNVADAKFWTVTGVMTASTITASELAGECANEHACDFMGSLSGRRKTYAVALPANFAMTFLTYELKKHHKRYWFVPAAASTAFTTVVAVHSKNRMR
jgi:hypothetical protein